MLCCPPVGRWPWRMLACCVSPHTQPLSSDRVHAWVNSIGLLHSQFFFSETSTAVAPKVRTNKRRRNWAIAAIFCTFKISTAIYSEFPFCNFFLNSTSSLWLQQAALTGRRMWRWADRRETADSQKWAPTPLKPRREGNLSTIMSPSIRHRRQPSVYHSVHTHFLPKTLPQSGASASLQFFFL